MGGLSTFNLGSNAGVDVVVELGVHFQNERLFDEFQNKVKISEKEMTNIIPQVQQANNMIKQLRGKLDDEKKKKFTELFELFKQKSNNHKFVTEKFEELKTSRFNQEHINIVVKGAAYPGAVIKYRRQIEKISAMQSAFMMSFLPGQESAPMTAISTKKK
jgi:signal transduction protein with GAF and PtsI domain